MVATVRTIRSHTSEISAEHLVMVCYGYSKRLYTVMAIISYLQSLANWVRIVNFKNDHQLIHLIVGVVNILLTSRQPREIIAAIQ